MKLIKLTALFIFTAPIVASASIFDAAQLPSCKHARSTPAQVASSLKAIDTEYERTRLARFVIEACLKVLMHQAENGEVSQQGITNELSDLQSKIEALEAKQQELGKLQECIEK